MVRVVVFLAENIRHHRIPACHAFARRADHRIEKELIVFDRVVVRSKELAIEVNVQAVLAVSHGHGVVIPAKSLPRTRYGAGIQTALRAFLQHERPAGISGKRGQNPGQTDTVCGLHRLCGERFLALV